MFYRISYVFLLGGSLMLWLMSPELGRTAGVPQDADVEQETDIFDLLDGEVDAAESDADAVAEEPVAEEPVTEDAAVEEPAAEDSAAGGAMDSTLELETDTLSDEELGDEGTGSETEEVPFSAEELDEAFGNSPISEEVPAEGGVTQTETVSDPSRVVSAPLAELKFEPMETIPAPCPAFGIPRCAMLKFEPMETIPAPAAIPAKPITPWRGQVRQYAPGVVRQIPDRIEPKDSVTRYDLVLPELAGGPDDLEWMKDVPVRRELWMLEFRFKPVGMLDVDIPQPNGQVERKKVWYLVYSVKNTGNVVVPEQGEDLTWSLKPSAKSVRFFPRFVLESTNVHKLYRDRVIPVAVDAIQRREGTRLRLLNTVEVVREIAPGEEVWGVATWDSVDPMTHQFSVYVQGLTNGYIWNQQADENGGVELTAGRTYRRTLKLNFLRRGDQYMVREDQILYGTTGGLDHEWVYR